MIKSFKEVEIGMEDNMILFIKKIENKESKLGEPFQKVYARDCEANEMVLIKFDAPITVQTPCIIKTNISCVEYNTNKSIRMGQYQELENADITPFMPKSRIDAKEYWSMIVSYIKSLRPGLARIACALIGSDRQRFSANPLYSQGSFSRQSGLMEATVKLCKLADNASEVLSLDRDLIITGSLLYYLGHLDTIDSGYNDTVADVLVGPGVSVYTKLQLFMHDILKSDNEEAKADLSKENIELLSHIILRKKDSAIPEALVLKNLSSLLLGTEEMQDMLSDAEENTIVVKGRQRYYKRTNTVNVISVQ